VKQEIVMPYTEQQIRDLASGYEQVCAGLKDMLERTVLSTSEIESDNAREYLLHGVGRRLGIIRKTIENVFNLFPPDLTRPPEREVIYDVQINIHAHVMNVSGIFDNWAWSFVLRHGLLEQVGGKHGVGLLKKETKEFLPPVIAKYIDKTINEWHRKYLKSYRDALAHRVPLYIPPAIYNEQESNRYKELEKEISESIRNQEWGCLEVLEKEQDSLGSPSFVFLHSFNEQGAKQIYFHPQLIADGNTVVEFGKLFMDNWHELA